MKQSIPDAGGFTVEQKKIFFDMLFDVKQERHKDVTI